MKMGMLRFNTFGMKRGYPRSNEVVERRRTEEQIEQESFEINAQVFKHVSFKMLKKKYTSYAPIRLNLDLNVYRDSKTIQAISKIKIPVIPCIKFDHIDFGNKYFRNFVARSPPTAIKGFLAVYMYGVKNTRYFNTLLSPSINKSRRFFINDFESINLKQLKRLFVSSKHCDSLKISDCTFSLPSDLDFSDCFRGTTLKTLELGIAKYVNPHENDKKLHQIGTVVSGLTKSSDLKKRPNLVSIQSEVHTTEVYEKILTKYGSI
ncbi:unnamed protein product [Moneuplotes crassus]|uniref:Uncharacterized protein n=1 Tax=Euplotes crassus TaxID=5936 RepID=A0AAD1XDC1_EUPCR|nr:unnamed protein product [Moneuplotes crassus]